MVWIQVLMLKLSFDKKFQHAICLLPGMERRELYIKSKFDGLPICTLACVPQVRPHAVMCLVHGLCGCKERFLPFMDYLTSNGFVCVACDLRGHGSSILNEEDRGYTYNGGAEAVVIDLDGVIDYICETYAGLPIYMLGHSMGSLAVRAYAKHHDDRLNGLVVCGSPSPNPLTPIVYTAFRFLCLVGYGHRRIGYIQKFISRRYNKAFRLEGYQAWTCSDPDIRRSYAEDPRCNFYITADCAATLMDLFRETYSKYGWEPVKQQLPIIFLSGDDDPCMINSTKFNRSVDRMRLNGYADVRCHTYAGMRHEILMELKKESVWADILNFIASA